MDVLTHLMFQDGRAREAAEWYVSLVPGSRVEQVVENDAAGTTVYFTLADRAFIAFDSTIRHDFDFTPSMSIFVRCDDDGQVHLLFSEIAAGGDVKMPIGDYGFSSCFGWATDRYGVSWQIGTACPPDSGHLTAVRAPTARRHCGTLAQATALYPLKPVADDVYIKCLSKQTRMAPWPTSSIEECSGPVSDFTTAKESSRFTGPTKASMFPWLSLSLQSTRRIGDSDSSGVIAEHWPTRDLSPAITYAQTMQPITRRPKPPDDPVGFRPNPRFQRIYEAKLANDVPTLINALADPDFRRTVARYLAGLGATEAIPEISRLLRVSDSDTRSAAARALGQLSASAAVPELVEMAQHDPSTVTRSWVIAALGHIGDPRAKDCLETIVANEEETRLRRLAASALGATGERSSIPILRRAARSDSLARRPRYYRAIWAITRRHHPS